MISHSGGSWKEPHPALLTKTVAAASLLTTIQEQPGSGWPSKAPVEAVVSDQVEPPSGD
jgi:hypothetical protein